VCPACGYATCGRLVLTSAETGKELQFSVSAQVGQRLLRTISPSDAPYASDPQFSVRKDMSVGLWVLEPAKGAKNPTFVDGEPIDGAPRQLVPGLRVSVGPERLAMTVRVDE
jgi:hypothetical protein